MISCLFFSASVRIISVVGFTLHTSNSLEKDSSSDDADDESKLVPVMALPGVVATDVLNVSSGCDSRGDGVSSLWIFIAKIEYFFFFLKKPFNSLIKTRIWLGSIGSTPLRRALLVRLASRIRLTSFLFTAFRLAVGCAGVLTNSLETHVRLRWAGNAARWTARGTCDCTARAMATGKVCLRGIGLELRGAAGLLRETLELSVAAWSGTEGCWTICEEIFFKIFIIEKLWSIWRFITRKFALFGGLNFFF